MHGRIGGEDTRRKDRQQIGHPLVVEFHGESLLTEQT
jgi:hypothetical protein